MPAATIIGLPAGGTFVDADGDTVTVRATGTTGTVTFTDATAGVVEDGDDIAGVVITGASSDFTLTYSFDASGGNADTVLMGDITSTRVIKGIFSIPLNNDGAPKGAFTLGSFVGPGFSLHGGLSADNLVGRTADDLGVQINNLETNRSLNFRGNVDGDILIKGNLNGNIAFGSGVTATSDITVRGSVSTNGKIAGNGDYLGTATFVGTFSGSATIDGDVDGTWTFQSSVPSSARFLATDFENLVAQRNFGGQILSNSEIHLEVGGSITGSAILSGTDDVVVNVTGGIQAGARLSSSDDVIATVGGNVSGIFTASGDLTLDVGGSLLRAKLSIGSDAFLTIDRGIESVTATIGGELEIDVTGGISDSVVRSGDFADINVTGSVTRSQLILLTDRTDTTVEVKITGNLSQSSITSFVKNNNEGDNSVEVEINIGGNMTNSSVTSFDASSDLTLTIGGNMTRSTVTADSDAFLNVAGNMTSSSVTTESDVSVNVAGNMTNSSITSSSSDISLTVGGNFTNSALTSDEDIEVEVTGDASGKITSYDSDITLNVGGSFSGRAIADEDLTAKLGSLNGSLTSESVDLFVTGNVSAGSVIQAISVEDLGDADLIGFRVGGTFAGKLTTVTLDSDEDNTGDGGDGINDLVVGNVLATAKFNIGVFNGNADEVYRFGGKFLGHLAISQTVNVNLEFNGDVHSIVIGGSVGVDIGGSDGGADEPNTITVNGKLTFLSSNSLFVSTGAGDGDFQDGAGVVTGNLITNGFTKVIPQITVAPV